MMGMLTRVMVEISTVVAALAQQHPRTAELFRDNGAHVNVHGYEEETPRHSAASHGNLELASK